jgi:hypothetical protein
MKQKPGRYWGVLSGFVVEAAIILTFCWNAFF